jgi:membrane associated rhomboid family serine protease
MWVLWIFGDNVEGRFGHILFLLFYLAAGVVAALAQLWFIAGMDIPMLGASGAVAGALGAYWALFSHHRVDAVVPLGFAFTTTTLPAGMVLLFWFVGQLFSGTASVVDGSASVGGVAFFAHIGGFVFGWIIAQFFKRRPMQPSLMA